MTLNNWLAIALGPLFAALVFLSWQAISQRSSLPGPLDLPEILEKYWQAAPQRSKAARALPVALILLALILLLYSIVG